MKPAHFSLFSGIGGLDIAAEMAGFQTVGQCELADYPTKILEKHWPDVPRWRDIRTITQEALRDELVNITGETYAVLHRRFCPVCGAEVDGGIQNEKELR